jgi:hypothetical protein
VETALNLKVELAAAVIQINTSATIKDAGFISAVFLKRDLNGVLNAKIFRAVKLGILQNGEHGLTIRIASKILREWKKLELRNGLRNKKFL